MLGAEGRELGGGGAVEIFSSSVSSHCKRQSVEAECQGDPNNESQHALHCLLVAAAPWEGFR